MIADPNADRARADGAEARRADYWEAATKIAREEGDKQWRARQAAEARAVNAEAWVAFWKGIAECWEAASRWRQASDAQRASRPAHDGAEALRSFGLDPATATLADVSRVFNERALRGHADHGGAADMAELVRQRDAARAYVEARK